MMPSLLTLVALALAGSAAAAIQANNYKLLIANINSIGNATQQLNTDVQKVTGNTFADVGPSLQVEVDAVNLDDLLLVATANAIASSNFGEPGSYQVSQAVLKLRSVVTQSLGNVTAKNATFGGLQPIVLASLYQLKQDTDSFGAAVNGKLEPLEKSIAPGIIKQFDASFNQAIAAYGGVQQPNTAMNKAAR